MTTLVLEPSRPVEVIVIDAVGDAAYVHACGAYVSPLFQGAGIKKLCPRCGTTV